jgi:hypothetical protein
MYQVGSKEMKAGNSLRRPYTVFSRESVCFVLFKSSGGWVIMVDWQSQSTIDEHNIRTVL